jgi:carboxyl-terminal processing protease
MIDPDNKIAYIRLTGFAGNTSRDLSRVMAKLDDQGVKGVILDVRFNPGGLLRAAVTISDLFIDDGPIVSVRPRVGREEKHTGRRAGSYLNFPMVCLVNGGSASASEIVSACLQDHKRAVIMGERSYGKGSVQNIQPFDGGQLKLTIATFWRPSNKNLNKSSTTGKDEDEWGVSPDKGFDLKLSRTEREALAEYQHDTEVIRPKDAKEKAKEFKDRQRDMAVEYLQKQIRTASK